MTVTLQAKLFLPLQIGFAQKKFVLAAEGV
jgi:hypothetical protein